MSNLAKQSLAHALKVKIEEKDLSKITIKELTDLCGLRRQTFYYHFKDIYDLLKWLYTNELIEEIRVDDGYESWQNCYLSIFKYVKSNQRLIISTYNSIASEYFLNFLNKYTSMFIKKIIEEKLEGKYIEEELEIFLSNFYKNALIGCVKDYVEQGMKEDPNEIVMKVDCILDGSIDLFLSNLENKYRRLKNEKNLNLSK